MWRLPRGTAAGALTAVALAWDNLQPRCPATAAADSPPPNRRTTLPLAWGANGFGQLGLGRGEDVASPALIEALRGGAARVVALSSSGCANTSAAVMDDGRVLAWGCGKDGRLGNGSPANSTVPVEVAIPSSSPVIAVALGELFMLALTATGEVWGWGSRAGGQSPSPPHTAASAAALASAPSRINGFAAPVAAVSAGREHAAAIDSDGRCYSWGVGSSYALGTGSAASTVTPRVVAALTGRRIVGVACGREHTLFLDSDGAPWSAGTNAYGQCGGALPFVRTPLRVGGLPPGVRIVSVAAGEYHSLALSSDGRVFAWGANREGGLGLGDRTDCSSPRELRLGTALPDAAGGAASSTVVAMAGGGGHSLFLTGDGRLLATGRGRSGQLGRGSALESVAAYRTVPVEVPLAQYAPFTRGRGRGRGDGGVVIRGISAGRDHSLALAEMEEGPGEGESEGGR